MRVAIVNDLPLAIEAIRRTLQSSREHDVAWVAHDGAEAIARACADRPDAILMDMLMPGVDGVEATRRIMRDAPCPILVVTATVEGNAARVYEALGCGAIDAVHTPTLGADGRSVDGRELLRKLSQVEVLLHRERGGRTERSATPTAAPRGERRIIAIGASTGGPQALLTLLRGLAKPVPVPILIVQHLGAEFVPGLAAWLTESAGVPVRLVRGPEPMLAGHAYVAAEETHLVALDAATIGTRPEPAHAAHRPSVDELFGSLAALAAGGVGGVGVLLTGMGRDGAEGLLRLRRAGWWTIAQDRGSSVVWGMPGEAVRCGAAIETLPLAEIGRSVSVALAGSGRGTGLGPKGANR
jgi:two-component system, chemotaxis family, response regulator WspF